MHRCLDTSSTQQPHLHLSENLAVGCVEPLAWSLGFSCFVFVFVFFATLLLNLLTKLFKEKLNADFETLHREHIIL